MTDDRPAGLAELPCHSRRYSGNTFIPFPLDPQAYKDKSLAEVVTDLLKRLPELSCCCGGAGLLLDRGCSCAPSRPRVCTLEPRRADPRPAHHPLRRKGRA